MTTSTKPQSDTAYGTASLVIGICSVFAGWLLIAPLIGLWLGNKSLKTEPAAHTRAKWGVAINGILLALWVLILVIFAVCVGVYGYRTSIG